MKVTGCLILLLAQAAQAQPKLSELLQAAERNNLDRRIVAEQRARAEAEARQAWASLLPVVSAQGSWTHNQFDASFDVPDTSTTPPTLRKLTIIPADQLDGVVRVDLPLLDASRWARVAASGKAREAAESREALTGDVVRRQVVAGYYGYAAALALRESARRSAGVAQAQLKLMEVRQSAGAVTELDLLRARAEAERTKQVVADTENMVSTSRRGLRTMTGLDPGDRASLPPDNLTPERPFEELEQGVEALPAVQAADRDAEAAARLAWGSRLALAPVVGAQFTERFTNATGFTGQSASYVAGVTLSWRIDVPTVLGFEAARATESSALMAAERTRAQARDQVHADWQRLTAALTKSEAAHAQVEAARRAAQVARDKYAVGLATQVDVIQAERDSFGAEVAQIQSRVEAASARVSLRLSAGLPLGVE